MMNNPAATAALKKRSSLSLIEAQTLLDLLTDAAVLVDSPTGLVLQTNAKSVELTAYTRTELTTLHLTDLFPELADCTPIWQPGDECERSTHLIRHGGAKLEAHIKFTLLDSNNGRWLLIAFEPVSQRQQRSAEKQQRASLWDAMHVLASANDLSEPETAIEKIMQAGRILTGTDILAVYLIGNAANSLAVDLPAPKFLTPNQHSIPSTQTGIPTETISLHREFSLGPVDLIPEEISLHDLNNLHHPTLWLPGKRAYTELHRAALASHLTCVASAPLGPQKALIGLVVAASSQIPPTSILLNSIETLAAYVARTIQSHVLVNNLQYKLTEQNNAITLGLAIKEAVQDGIILVLPDMTILEMNLSAEQMLGYTSREVAGHPLEDILISEDNIYSALVTARAARIREHHLPATIYPQVLGNAVLYRRDGRAISTQLRILELADHNQRLGEETSLPWVVLIQDLSQEEQFRLRTQQLEQRALLGEVTAVFAHEVRNPINNISTGLQLMALNLPSDDPNQELIGRLQQDCDRLAELMKSVLAFARPKEYKLEPVDLNTLLLRLLERWLPRLGRANVQQNIQIEDQLPSVMADPRAIEQVFNNLIANANQAMAAKDAAAAEPAPSGSPAPMGGVLTIKVRTIPAEDECPAFVETSVSDTGLGIPDEIRERIFEPFFTTRPGGTGLGLAITKQIVTAHRGVISVTSVPGGTVFSVRLPSVRAARATPGEPSEPIVRQEVL